MKKYFLLCLVSVSFGLYAMEDKDKKEKREKETTSPIVKRKVSLQTCRECRRIQEECICSVANKEQWVTVCKKCHKQQETCLCTRPPEQRLNLADALANPGAFGAQLAYQAWAIDGKKDKYNKK